LIAIALNIVRAATELVIAMLCIILFRRLRHVRVMR